MLERSASSPSLPEPLSHWGWGTWGHLCCDGWDHPILQAAAGGAGIGDALARRWGPPIVRSPRQPSLPRGQSQASSRCQTRSARAGLGTDPPRWEQRDGHLCPQGGTSLLPAGTAPIRHVSPRGQGTPDWGMACGRGQGAERAAAVPDPWAERLPAPQPPAPLPPPNPGTYLMVFFSLRPRLESGVPTVSREVL